MVQHKATQIPGRAGMDFIVIEKKKKLLQIPKDLNLIGCWDIIGPELEKEFNEGYTAIPFCIETDAYRIGHIFVPFESQVKCFRVTEVVKVIGPISNFVVMSKTNSKFLNPKIDVVKRQPDVPNIRMVLNNRKRVLKFRGYDCLFLDKPADTIVEANVTIDRSSHEDLVEAKWFGIITNVFVTKTFQINALRGSRTRTTYISDDMHTVLFKYEICEMNECGFVTKVSKNKIDFRWASILEQPQDILPLPKFFTVPKK